MIYVDRSSVPCPAILGGTPRKGNGPDETMQAIRHYTSRSKQSKPFPFRVYSDGSVKAALTTLFNNKCAYCEFRYGAGMPAEVEHWRPKGEVDDDAAPNGKRRPAYYWLAAAWDNLFPSCIDCNRQRYHRTGDGNKRVLLGKKNAWYQLLIPNSELS